MKDAREELQRTLSGSYTIERELTGGGMSRVFVAKDTTLDRLVVVKLLAGDLAAGVSGERFARETKTAAKLQQANIVPVLATGTTSEGIPYYTMPFVEGESLRSHLAKTGRMSVGDAVGILRDVTKALAYAHAHGIVHRDIKPDNVLLSGGTAVVTDFGIAKAITAAREELKGATLTQLGTAIGTPAYMSPEQAAGDPDTDHRADIYSLGCLAFELLAGEPVFQGKRPHQLLAAHMSETPRSIADLRPDTPPELAALVMRCLEKEPGKRPATAVEVGNVLATVVSAGGLATMPSILIDGPGMLKRALAFYAFAFAAVAILAQAAIVVIGLPDWVLPGAMIVMALGLPAILFTAYVARVNHQVATITPQYTPGGTPSLTHGTIRTLALKATPHVSWRRTAMGGTYALGGFTLLVGGFMALRAMGIGPAGSLLASGRFASKEPLLVTDFKVTNGDSSLGRVLGDATKATLSDSKVITLVTPEFLASALRRMDRPPTATLLFPVARELAMRNNIKAIVDGEVTGLGAAGYIVTIKLVTTDSVREMASFRESASDARGLIVAVDKLSRRLRGKVGESLRSVRNTLALRDATTGSLEALRKFVEGSRVAELEGNNNKAIEILREAVAIDTTFAGAYRKLAIVMSNAGRPRIAIDSQLRRAYKYRDRLGPSEYDYVTAAYFSNGPGRDRAKAEAAYRSMLARGDSVNGAANNLALLVSTKRQFALAETLYRAQERLCAGCFRTLYGNLGFALTRQGKYAAADSALAAGLKIFPDNAVWHRNRITLLYYTDSAAHRRAVDSVALNGDSTAKAFARAQKQNLSLRDGKIAEWRRLMNVARGDTAKATPRQRLNFALNGDDNQYLSEYEGRERFVEQRLDAALAAFNVASLPEIERPYIGIASWYANVGRTDKARRFLAQHDALGDTAYLREMIPTRAWVVGNIALAEKKWGEAVAAFTAADRQPDGPADACVLCLPLALGDAYSMGGQRDSAIKYYEEFLTTPSPDHPGFDRAVLAPTFKTLGELYEQQGNKTKAAKYYTNFVNLWKNADPVLQPHVAEVRRRLSRIADIEQKKP